MVVKPEIKRMEDLRGKTIGISDLEGVADVGTRLALKKYGIVPDVEAKIVVVRDSPTRYTGLLGVELTQAFCPSHTTSLP